MSRIEPISPERMTPVQRSLHDRIARAGRRAASGPWVALLHAPEVGERVADFVDYFSSGTRVPEKLKRIAVLVIARAYTAQYEWSVHEQRARARGLDTALIEAIRERARPVFGDPDEALAYDVTCEIVEARTLNKDLYGRAVEALGEATVVELVALIGFYIAVAILCVSYDVAPPEGAAPLLPR